jgi:cytochrome c
MKAIKLGVKNMKYNVISVRYMFKWVSASLMFILLLLISGGCLGSEGEQKSEDSLERQIAIGRQIYQHGILANGEPVEAYVMGDVPVLGTQFTCLNCHGRSGLGGAEGKTYTLAINPTALFNPRDSLYLERSAYDEQSLEVALRQGKTPEGTSLTPAMPIYDLPDREMAALVAYLQVLSSEFSPGMTGEVIHIATVISDQVGPITQRTMLGVLHGWFQDKNAKTRYEHKRLDYGPFYQHYRLKAYRKWVLHEWTLHGSPETWTKQLEEYYEQQPVFAMIGGVVQGSWEPIHQFCEENEIPSLLPNTDQPGGLGTDDFYTLYFSEGLQLEARIIAADLIATKRPVHVLQVYRPGQNGAFGARSFRKTVVRTESVTVAAEWKLEEGVRFTRSELVSRAKAAGADTVILWLPNEELKGESLEGIEQSITGHIYLSSSLLGGILATLPPELGKGVRLAHPFILPKDQEAVFNRVRVWFENRKIPYKDNPRIAGQTFYACLMMREGLMHIKRHFYRDYLLDALDHGNSKSIYSVNYPRLSYGPGQRYLAKGAFILENPESSGGKDLPAKATWIVPHL